MRSAQPSSPVADGPGMTELCGVRVICTGTRTVAEPARANVNVTSITEPGYRVDFTPVSSSTRLARAPGACWVPNGTADRAGIVTGEGAEALGGVAAEPLPGELAAEAAPVEA